MNVNQQSMITSCRRNMNPSLQPSLSELIEHQQNQQQIRQQQQQTLNSHLNNHLSNRSSNNDTNNNLSSSLDSNPNNNLIDYNSPFYLGNQTNPIATSSGLHLGSMDIEYFDNTLAQFDFSLPSSGTQLATANQTPSTTHFDGNDQPMVNTVNNTSNGIMSSTSAYYPNTSNNANNHVLDLFNIDDFKMSDSLPWSEVDYAV